ncbi:MAG: hypothetical protein LBR98_02550 [Syntrophomonadaceae bacterium]|jgi:hypothetical protein|nr:hypothetical protein [Syntrophomonadaceae bacterium]
MAKYYKEYDIKRPGFTDGIKVRIYKTPESMRKGYLAEWAKYTRQKNTEDLSDTVGFCFDVPPMVSDRAEGLFVSELYAIIFLNEKFLTPEIAIHECVHATFTHEQDIERFEMDYSYRENKTHEERFCYYLGWLSAELLQLLKKEGFLR